MAAHQAPPSLGFSRQEQWSGLPFPSPMHESEKWKQSQKLSHVRPLATPWTAAHQAPPSMGFSRQEYWSGVPLFFFYFVRLYYLYKGPFLLGPFSFVYISPVGSASSTLLCLELRRVFYYFWKHNTKQLASPSLLPRAPFSSTTLPVFEQDEPLEPSRSDFKSHFCF